MSGRPHAKVPSWQTGNSALTGFRQGVAVEYPGRRFARCRIHLESPRVRSPISVERRGSSSATIVHMTVIPQKELRNQVGAVLRRVEGGESLTVTVSGRAVARLTPIRHRHWVSGDDLSSVWSGPPLRGVGDDLAEFGGTVTDPFAP